MGQPSDLPGNTMLSSIFAPPGAIQSNAGAGGPTLEQYMAGQSGPTSTPGVPGTAQPTPDRAPAGAPAAPAAQPGSDPFNQFGSAFGQPQAQPGQAPQAPANPFDQFAGAFGGVPSTMPRKGDQYDDTASQSWGEMWQRLKANLGRDPNEVASILEGSYGQGNVRVKGDKVYFRKPGETKFRNLDPKQFEFFGDLFADMSGNMVEAGVAAPFEALGMKAAQTSAASGPWGMAAAVPMAAGGMYAGAYEGQRVRQGLVGMAGGSLDPSLNNEDETLKSMGVNAATMGMGKLVGAGLGKLSQALADSPIMRIKSIAKAQAALESIADSYRVGSRYTPEDTGGMIKTVVQRERARLNGFVMAARSAVETKAGDTKFPVENTLRSLQTVLKDQGVAFDKDGTAVMAGSLKDESYPVMREYDRMSPILGENGKPITTQEIRPENVTVPGAPVQAPLSPLGTPGGDAELQKMVDMYNQLQVAKRNGGVDAKALFRMASETGDMGNYHIGEKLNISRQAADKVSSRWRAINGGTIADRDAAAVASLDPDSPDLAAYKGAMQTYHDRIDGLKYLETMVHKAEDNGTMPTLTNSIIAKNAPERIRAFKRLLGDSPTNDLNPGQTWDTVKGSWFSQLLNSTAVRDQSTGAISGKKLLGMLNDYGKDVRQELFSDKEFGDIRKMSLYIDKIQKSDLGLADSSKAFLELPVWDTAASGKNLANMLWGMTGQKAKLVEQLLDDGFMQAYRNDAGPNRAKIVGAMQQLQAMYDRSIRTVTKEGVEQLKLPSTYYKMFGLPLETPFRGNVAGAGQTVLKGTQGTMKDIKQQAGDLKNDVRGLLQGQ